DAEYVRAGQSDRGGGNRIGPNGEDLQGMTLPRRAVDDGSPVGSKACPEEVASTKCQLTKLRNRRLVRARPEPAIPGDSRGQEEERHGDQTQQRKRSSALGLARRGNVTRSL